MGQENRDRTKVEKKKARIVKNNVNTFVNCTRSVKCLYTNADSLMNKIDELKVLVRDEKPHIIGICEVKPKNCRYSITDAELQLDGYDMFHTNLSHGKHRGCILYIDKEIEATEITLIDAYKDTVWCEIKL